MRVGESLTVWMTSSLVLQDKTFNGSRGFHSTAAAHQQPVSAPEMIEVFVNDQPLQIPKGSTVMAACDAAGIDIPRSAALIYQMTSSRSSKRSQLVLI